MDNKFIRVLSPITAVVVGIMSVGTVCFSYLAVTNLLRNVNFVNVAFCVIMLIMIVVCVLVMRVLFTTGVRFTRESMEFTAIDDNNVFYFSDIKKIESHRDDKASFTKNFVDRYSSIIIYLNDDTVATIELGLTTKRTLSKLVEEINSRL